MNIEMIYLGLIRRNLGKKNEELEILDGSSLFDLLVHLDKYYGEKIRNLLFLDENSELDPSIIVTINGVLKNLFNAKKVFLNDGDKIALMSFISGG